MNAFWGIVASNAVFATILAVGVMLMGRLWKNAAAVHVLWVVVLLKLFTPPLFTAELPIAFLFLPPEASIGSQEKGMSLTAIRETGQTAPVAVTAARGVVAEVNQQQTHRDRTTATAVDKLRSLSLLLAAIWICGTGFTAAVYAVRIQRFAHGIREFEVASPAIRSMVAQLSNRLGLRRDPDVLMTSRALPPLVWSFGNYPRVILPSRLFAQLSSEAQSTILAHELVHIRRGDYLVRLLELAATTVFWWHPVVWLASWHLRELEEQCCDGRVLELLPDRPRTYAAALVDTLEFLSGGICTPVPLRTAFHSTHSLSRRIHMLTQPRTHRLSALSCTIVVGLASLPLAVAFAIGPDQAGKAAPGNQQPAVVPVAVLRGRVTTKAGVPLPGARVRVAIPAADMRFVDSSTDQMQLETKSDANGDYAMELPGIAKPTTISIDAMMPGFRRLSGTLMAGGDARRIEVEPGKAVEAILPLEPARYFRGIVVDEQGQPIPSVRVSANFVFDRASGGIERTASNADGSFELFNYSAEPHAFGNLVGKGGLCFSHPNYIEFRVDDIDEIEPNQRRELRFVLQTGHRVTGTVLDVAGKPVSNAMVEAALEPGIHRKATLTDANGHFALRGLSEGPTTLNANSLDIKQKVQLSMALNGNKDGLEVRLQPISMPADLKKHAVLGMQLADVTPELQSAYNLRQDRGALIIDPGKDFDRLKIGELVEGYLFWEVGDTRVGSVREFVDQILKETEGRVADEYSVRVVYSFKTPEFVGTNTQYLKLTKDDMKQLQEKSDRFKADAR